jgi:hypothetical protein
MGQCQTKYSINSIVPYSVSESQLSENYIKDSHNLTKRREKRTRSRIIYDAFEKVIV